MSLQHCQSMAVKVVHVCAYIKPNLQPSADKDFNLCLTCWPEVYILRHHCYAFTMTTHHFSFNRWA